MVDNALPADFEEQILKFINAEISLFDEPIEGDTDLLLTGAVDSLGVMCITRWIEDELGFEVEATDITLDNFQTVEQTLRYCRARFHQV
jgi:acyl carrier protein